MERMSLRSAAPQLTDIVKKPVAAFRKAADQTSFRSVRDGVSKIVIHPYLILLEPVFSTYPKNATAIYLTDVAIVALKGVLLLAALVAAATFVFKSYAKASLFVGTVALLFLNYGTAYDTIHSSVRIFGRSPMSRHYHIFALLAAIIAFARYLRRSDGMVRFANVVLSITFLITFGAQIATETIPSYNNVKPALDVASQWSPEYADVGLDPSITTDFDRDIYYLIFDRYPNQRTLEDRFGFDNGDFYDELEQRGFNVASNPNANYHNTSSSLSSSLNMRHHDDLLAELGVETVSGASHPLYERIRNSVAAKFLKESGYEYLNVASWFVATRHIDQADVEYRHERHISLLGKRIPISDVSALVAPSTILKPLSVEPITVGDTPLITSDIELPHKASALNQVESLRTIANDSGDDGDKKFVLGHFILPHPPYVFDHDGTDLTPEVKASRSNDENFINQLQYTNQLIIETIDHIYEKADGDRPLIILQSDEGPYFERLTTEGLLYPWAEITDLEITEKVGILNAVNDPAIDLDDTSTPVNTFRKIFNTHFGQELELLPETTHIYDAGVPYRYVDVTDRILKASNS